jgi:hypothetical protein
MPNPDLRAALGLAQFNTAVPADLNEQACAILRKENRTISEWVRSQLHDLIADYHQRQAWELRQG